MRERKVEFPGYIDKLCREHKWIRHSDNECHFSNLISDFDNKLQRIMNYPCVGIDTDGFYVDGPNELETHQYNMYFLQHVKDHGDINEKLHAFGLTYQILEDFIARFKRDKMAGLHPVQFFDGNGMEAARIEFADNALYGWVLSIKLPQRISYLNCNNNFLS